MGARSCARGLYLLLLSILMQIGAYYCLATVSLLTATITDSCACGAAARTPELAAAASCVLNSFVVAKKNSSPHAGGASVLSYSQGGGRLAGYSTSATWCQPSLNYYTDFRLGCFSCSGSTTTWPWCVAALAHVCTRLRAGSLRAPSAASPSTCASHPHTRAPHTQPVAAGVAAVLHSQRQRLGEGLYDTKPAHGSVQWATKPGQASAGLADDDGGGGPRALRRRHRRSGSVRQRVHRLLERGLLPVDDDLYRRRLLS